MQNEGTRSNTYICKQKNTSNIKPTSDPALRCRNRGKYRTADTACFSKIPKNIATAYICGAVLFLVKTFYTFLHLFYKISLNTAVITGIETGKEKYAKLKNMTFSRRCRMFF